MKISQETELKFRIYYFIEKQICEKISERERESILNDIEIIIQSLKHKTLK